MSANTAVVHLVWGPLGPDPLARFLSAYARCEPGEDHDLVLLLNGVEPDSGSPLRAALLEQLTLPHRVIELQRPVQDLDAYFQAAARLDHRWLCFLNSHSEPLVEGWLALLAGAARERDVGMAGASGSWASQHSHMRYLLGLGGPYAKVYSDRESVRRAFAASPSHGQVPSAGAVRSAYETWRRAQAVLAMPPFPCPHVRTNAFLIDRRAMLSLRRSSPLDKTGAYALESGRRSITRQLWAGGRRVLLVGRDGVSREWADWAAGEIFWQGAQANLLVADNQTRGYDEADIDVRRLLSAHAWGESANPSPPARTAAAASEPQRG